MNMRHILSHGSGQEIIAALEHLADEADDQLARNAGHAAGHARQDAYVRFRNAAAARGEYDLGETSSAGYRNPFGYQPTEAENLQIEAEAETAARAVWESSRLEPH
jgi:hypothetical protein